MIKPYLRRIDRAARARQHAAPPDFTGWTADQILLWQARNGKYEEVVAQANQVFRPTMTTPEEREAQLRADGKWPAEAEPPSLPAEVEAEAEADPGPGPGQPTGPPPWWEEKAQWRHRGPQDDADENAKGYFVEHEYDPLDGY